MTIGTAYQRLNRIDDARSYIELARNLNPKSGEPPARLASLALAREPKDPQTMLGFMETAVKLQPSHAGYDYKLAWRGEQLCQTSKAAEVGHGYLRAYMVLSRAQKTMAYTKGAIAAAEEAQRIRPEAPEVNATRQRLGGLQKDSKK